jgi:hypothetical protein
MLQKVTPIFCVLIVLAFMSSCTVEKKRYSSGYHVDWHHKKDNYVHEKKDSSNQRAETSVEKSETDLGHQEDLVSSISNDDLPLYKSNLLNKAATACYQHANKHMQSPINFAKHRFWQKSQPKEEMTTEQLLMRYQRRNTISLFAIFLGPFAVALVGFTVMFLSPFVALGIIIGMISMNLNTREETKGITEFAKQRKRAGALLTIWLLIYGGALLFWYALLFYIGGY